MSSPESLKTSPEQQLSPEALEAAGHERRETLRDSLDKAETKHSSKKESSENLEKIQREAIEKAESLKDIHSSTETSPAKKRIPLFTKHQRDISFNRQMDHVHEHMSGSERQFSKFIHNKSVEKVSDGLGATIARPNALLAGSITAFISVTIVYVVAKHYGYQLSGFETIGAFILGWILGLIYDYVRALITGGKKE
jgi:hypothetical protein